MAKPTPPANHAVVRSRPVGAFVRADDSSTGNGATGCPVDTDVSTAGARPGDTHESSTVFPTPGLSGGASCDGDDAKVVVRRSRHHHTYFGSTASQGYSTGTHRRRSTLSMPRESSGVPTPTESHRLRVIITADDFGLAHPVNEAVEQAHQSGVLTSASLMVAESGAADAIRRARRQPTLRVGLHLAVVDGRPMLPPERIQSLVDRSGRLPDQLFRAGVRYFFRPTARRQLRDEVRAQLESFRGTGLTLDHVDTHRHMVLHPTVLSAIIELAPEFDIRAVRVPAEPLRATRGLPLTRRIGAAGRVVLLAPWIALVRWRLRRAGIACNSEVRGLADTGAMNEATVLRLISTLTTDITEIFFHPATASFTPVPLPQSVPRHVAELDALCSARVRTGLAEAGAQAVGFGDLNGTNKRARNERAQN
jgi:chitin disaccharide deacetylase